jgi:hypothetical protein
MFMGVFVRSCGEFNNTGVLFAGVMFAGVRREFRDPGWRAATNAVTESISFLPPPVTLVGWMIHLGSARHSPAARLV